MIHNIHSLQLYLYVRNMHANILLGICMLLICLFCFAIAMLRRGVVKMVCVVVLGDIGRSPRMQYHSLSLVLSGYTVNLIGYGDSVPHRDVVNSKQILMRKMRELPKVLQRLPRLVLYAVKVFWQSCTLFYTLLSCGRPSHILVQNPPALPALLVCWAVCKLRGSLLVIDWHNYGYTILSLALSPHHPLVKISKSYERFCGRLSTFNICVTNAMRRDLNDNWQIRAVTLYDRPPSIFKDVDLPTQHKLFCKLAQQYDEFKAHPADQVEKGNCFLEQVNTDDHYRSSRPALIMSSTSWTEDEDFSILLNALDIYDRICREVHDSNLPDILCVITGKGPLKEYYREKMASRSWKHVHTCTPWLTAEDYPTLIGSADLGVCLHMSSSGLDLPMKVVDMFGCRLPVCALNFNCLSELVKHDHNGMVFSTEDELAIQLQELLSGFPNKCTKLSAFKENLREFQQTRWNATWNEHVLPIFS